MPVVRDWHSYINVKVTQSSVVTGCDNKNSLRLIRKTKSARLRWAKWNYAFKAKVLTDDSSSEYFFYD